MTGARFDVSVDRRRLEYGGLSERAVALADGLARGYDVWATTLRCWSGWLDRVYPHGYTVVVIEVIQTEHFRRWIGRLRDRGARARILARIIAVEEGHFGDWKAIDRAVFELRVQAGPGYRVYFTRRGSALVILLAGGDKRSQRRDIEMARKLAAEIRDFGEPGP